MRMYDIIAHKKNGGTLSREEIDFLVRGVTDGSIPDYQTTALLMAICFAGMDARETADLTMAMAHSGDTIDLSAISGVKADKHSTGGVGDKTTLIVAPLVAACGVKMAKMSGRGLGHTGGTVDKLESIPGYRTQMGPDEFLAIADRVGLCVVGQSGDLAPADKRLYALRDVTATVDCMPLIASSIMSKKLAVGADVIVLDVKTGGGAFMKTPEASVALARAMVDIGNAAGRRCAALVTDMDTPLGAAVGNALEVVEAVETLRGRGPEDLTALCVELSACILHLAGRGDEAQCRALCVEALRDGRALDRLCAMVDAQGGDARYVREPERFEGASASMDVCAPRDGVLCAMDAEGIGIASVLLGAGRDTKDAPIDHAAGLLLRAKTGARVRAGDPLATLFAADEARLRAGAEKLRACYEIGDADVERPPLIHQRVMP